MALWSEPDKPVIYDGLDWLDRPSKPIVGVAALAAGLVVGFLLAWIAKHTCGIGGWIW
jgi:hypothetical protein